MWAQILTPFLSGEAQRVYYALSTAEVADNKTSKAEILARCGLSPTNTVAEFHYWTYRPSSTSQAQMDPLLPIAKRWLQPERCTATEGIERLVMDRFLRALPPEERKAIGMSGTNTPER